MDGNKGIAALRKKLITCCEQPYQLVIVDLNMPNLDGIGMMDEIQRMQKEEGKLLEYKDSLFIIATCQTKESLDNDFRQHGFKYFLQKPIQASEVLKIAQENFQTIEEESPENEED